MKITKSENRERYLAEQQTGNGAIVGFGATPSAAINEACGKIKCEICGYTLTCHHCRSAKGARATNAKLTAEQLSAKMKKAVMAREAKKKQKQYENQKQYPNGAKQSA